MRLKRPIRDVDYSPPPSTAELDNERRYTSAPTTPKFHLGADTDGDTFKQVFTNSKQRHMNVLFVSCTLRVGID